MVVNGYTEALNYWKMLRKTEKKQQPAEKQNNIWKTKYKLSEIAFQLDNSPLCPPSLTPLLELP